METINNEEKLQYNILVFYEYLDKMKQILKNLQIYIKSKSKKNQNECNMIDLWFMTILQPYHLYVQTIEILGKLKINKYNYDTFICILEFFINGICNDDFFDAYIDILSDKNYFMDYKNKDENKYLNNIYETYYELLNNINYHCNDQQKNFCKSINILSDKLANFNFKYSSILDPYSTTKILSISSGSDDSDDSGSLGSGSLGSLDRVERSFQQTQKKGPQTKSKHPHIGTIFPHTGTNISTKF